MHIYASSQCPHPTYRAQAARARVALPNDSDEAALRQRLRQLTPSLLRPSVVARAASAPALLMVTAVASLARTAILHPPPLSYLMPRASAIAVVCIAVVGVLAAAFPSDLAVARNAAYYLLTLLAISSLVPPAWVGGGLGMLVLAVTMKLSRPTVLSAAQGGATEGSDELAQFSPSAEQQQVTPTKH